MCILLLCLLSRQAAIEEADISAEALKVPLEEAVEAVAAEAAPELTRNPEMEKISQYLEKRKDMFICKHMEFLSRFCVFDRAASELPFTLESYEDFVSMELKNSPIREAEEELPSERMQRIRRALFKKYFTSQEELIMFLMANYSLSGKSSEDQVPLAHCRIRIRKGFLEDPEHPYTRDLFEENLAQLPTIICSSLSINITERENLSEKALPLLLKKFSVERLFVCSDSRLKYPASSMHLLKYPVFETIFYDEIVDPPANQVVEAAKEVRRRAKEKPLRKISFLWFKKCTYSLISFFIAHLQDCEVLELCVEDFSSKHGIDFLGKLSWTDKYSICLKEIDSSLVDLKGLLSKEKVCSKLQITEARKTKRILGLEPLIMKRQLLSLEIDWLLFQAIDRASFSAERHPTYAHTIASVESLTLRYAPTEQKKYVPSRKRPAWLYIEHLFIYTNPGSKKAPADLSTLYRTDEILFMGLFYRKSISVKVEEPKESPAQAPKE